MASLLTVQGKFLNLSFSLFPSKDSNIDLTKLLENSLKEEGCQVPHIPWEHQGLTAWPSVLGSESAVHVLTLADCGLENRGPTSSP